MLGGLRASANNPETLEALRVYEQFHRAAPLPESKTELEQHIDHLPRAAATALRTTLATFGEDALRLAYRLLHAPGGASTVQQGLQAAEQGGLLGRVGAATQHHSSRLHAQLPSAPRAAPELPR